MALAVDSFQHLIDLFQKDLHERCGLIVNGLAIIGAVYITKKIVQTALYCYSDIKTYGLAKLWKTPFCKHGGWAVVSISEDFTVSGFVDELALNGLDVLLIGTASCLQKETITRPVNTKLEHIIIDYNSMDKSMEAVDCALAGKDIRIFICSANFKDLSEKAFHSLTYKDVSELTQMNMTYITQIYCMAIARMTHTNRNRGVIVTITPYQVFPSSLSCAWMAYVKLLQSKLRRDYKSIEFLNLNPYEIDSNRGNNWKILDLRPSPESYARSALATVGWTSQTTGHIYYQLQMRVCSIFTALLGAFAFQVS